MGRRKNANGQGSVFKLSNGKWRAQITLPAAPGEKPSRPTRTCDTKMQALAARDELRQKAKLATPTRATVAMFLAEWMRKQETRKKSLKRSTLAHYRNTIDVHLVPGIGHHRLDSLGPKVLDDWFDELDAGDRTRQVCYDVLRAALNYAFDMEMIQRNPLKKVERPQAKREKINPFTATEALRLIEETEGQRWHAAIVLGLTIGARQAEMFGLRWSDVDLKHRLLSIEQTMVEVSGQVGIDTTKTEGSTRVVMLPDVATEALIEHRKILLVEKLAGHALVFPARRGGLPRRSNFRVRFWNPLLARLGFDHRGAHHLRHTFATLALGAGVPVHVVAQILGHSQPSTTLDIYSHAIKPQQADAIARIQSLLGQATATPLLTSPPAESPQLQSG